MVCRGFIKLYLEHNPGAHPGEHRGWWDADGVFFCPWGWRFKGKVGLPQQQEETVTRVTHCFEGGAILSHPSWKGKKENFQLVPYSSYRLFLGLPPLSKWTGRCKSGEFISPELLWWVEKDVALTGIQRILSKVHGRNPLWNTHYAQRDWEFKHTCPCYLSEKSNSYTII